MSVGGGRLDLSLRADRDVVRGTADLSWRLRRDWALGAAGWADYDWRSSRADWGVGAYLRGRW